MSISTSEAAAHAGVNLTFAHGDRDLVGADPAGEPPRSDAGSVPRELRGRAVGIPDDDLGSRAVGGDHFEHSVRADPKVVVAYSAHELGLQRCADLLPLDEEIVVSEAVPFREAQSADSVTKRSEPQAERTAASISAAVSGNEDSAETA
jgi:hypothetical protein